MKANRQLAKKKCPASEKTRKLSSCKAGVHCVSANKEAWNFLPFLWLSIKVVSSNGVTRNFPLCMGIWHSPSTPPLRNLEMSKHVKMDSMDSDSNIGGSVKQTESCSNFLSNGIKRQMSNSSDTSDADECQRKPRRPKLRQRPTWQVSLPSCKHHYEEDTLDDDRLFDSNKTISACSKIVSAVEDGFASSNESESGLADLPHPYLPYINKATNDWQSPLSQDTENKQLSTFSVDSDCSDHTEINAAVMNEEAEDQTHRFGVQL